MNLATRTMEAAGTVQIVPNTVVVIVTLLVLFFMILIGFMIRTFVLRRMPLKRYVLASCSLWAVVFTWLYRTLCLLGRSRSQRRDEKSWATDSFDSDVVEMGEPALQFPETALRKADKSERLPVMALGSDMALPFFAAFSTTLNFRESSLLLHTLLDRLARVILTPSESIAVESLSSHPIPHIYTALLSCSLLHPSTTSNVEAIPKSAPTRTKIALYLTGTREPRNYSLHFLHQPPRTSKQYQTSSNSHQVCYIARTRRPRNCSLHFERSLPRFHRKSRKRQKTSLEFTTRPCNGHELQPESSQHVTRRHANVARGPGDGDFDPFGDYRLYGLFRDTAPEKGGGGIEESDEIVWRTEWLGGLGKIGSRQWIAPRADLRI
ncbi:hypothetical protein EJ04DRAFT_526525 [Polyplosphaeria fusca]|uniref:Uncharacterized protein n=1 Tax=Polyplosphaeria fusca TaxID=682080 RepID=A0A9P4QR67_9PLEO|nr:hypothetical protein EJ04DRAFT_526525 [Polyplosphaeria fusca]